MLRFRAIPAFAAVLLTAACASTTHTAAPAASSPAAQSPTTAASPTPSAPPTTAAAAGSPAGHGNIVLSTNAKTLPPGPFRITPISCGPYTAAQQAKFGTNAKGGLVYRYTNVSNSLTGAPALTVDFMNGTDVLGDNVTGNAADIGPGQSAEAYVDGLDGSGGNLTFTSCELMQYGLRGMAGANFAP